MSDTPPLINLGDLAKPATALVERVSNAIGVLYEPKRIVRKAIAEAEAEKIKAIAGIEISEIQQRGLKRLIHEEGRKQENIENITKLALEDLREDAKPENIDEDWLVNFFEKCKLFSDRDMQILWGRILAGEANKAGTFSKRTIEVVSTMEKSDAELFTSFCTFCWCFHEVLYPVILETPKDIYSNNNIYFSTLNHLVDIGLIQFRPDASIGKKKDMSPILQVIQRYDILITILRSYLLKKVNTVFILDRPSLP